MKGLAAKVLGLAAALALLLAVMAGVWLASAGEMLRRDDAPQVSQAMVLLSGSYRRDRHAADLFARGLANAIWVARPAHRSDEAVLAEVGLGRPPQEEIHRRLLRRYGVPEAAIRLYGQGVLSTAQEAAELRRALGPVGSLLVVTSPPHSRRAGMIFEDAFPEARVLVSVTDEPFPRLWWTDQASALAVVRETAKLVWYLTGGRFTSQDMPDGAAPKGSEAGGD